MRSRALWIEEPGRASIRTAELSPPGPDEVLVETLHSGISRGTESLIFQGAVPPSLMDTMRCPFQEGTLPGPVKYGYSSVGRLAETGEVVFCLYPHQDAYVVPRSAVHPLPADVPPARAILAANLETALNGVWDAAVGPGDNIAVVGGGVVGCLAGWLCAQMPGCSVTLVDIDPSRAGIAATLGMGFALPEDAADNRDGVIHASGAPTGLRTSLRLAGREATITELSWYGTRAVSVPLGERFHPERLTIRSSQVGRIPPARQPRWTYRRRLSVVLGLLAAPELDALISGSSPFDALPSALARLVGAPSGALCHRVDYQLKG